MKDEIIKNSIKEILEHIGEDPSREGLKETPNRMMRSWKELFCGYNQNVSEIFTFFKEDDVVPFEQIILLKDIEFFSTCEHHFLPFIGKAHVAYIPSNKIVGISKLARVVDVFSRRLQIQERIGNQVTEALMEHLEPLAAACIIEAKHLCMSCRGVGKINSVMVTSSLKGGFLNNPKSRKELMSLIKA